MFYQYINIPQDVVCFLFLRFFAHYSLNTINNNHKIQDNLVLINSLSVYAIQMINFVTILFQRESSMHDNRGSVVIGNKQVKSDQCLHQLLGDYVDVEWNIKTGVMNVSSTKHQKYSHVVNQDLEAFQYVPLMHGAHCPLLNENVIKNHQRLMRPCSVILLENKETNTILATQRPLNISFGGKWVIPGGHLEIGQGIIEGGIRECSEEVGFNKESIQQIKSDVMIWQSVYTVNSEVKATGLVVFFRIQTKLFQVIAQKGEIQNWQWRKMEKGGEPWGDGWAQGHLAYLRFINEMRN